MLASLVLRLCIKALDALAEEGKALSSEADELMLELDPVKGPVGAIMGSLTGEALRRIVSSISCFAWLKTNCL